MGRGELGSFPLSKISFQFRSLFAAWLILFRSDCVISKVVHSGLRLSLVANKLSMVWPWRTAGAYGGL